MTTKKTTSSAILDANGNNGLHSERALYTAQTILKHHDLRQPVMYHLIFTGGTIAQYQAAIKALVKHLRRNKCRTEYFGAYENQPLKGLHAHLFLVIETAKKFPDKIIDIREGGYLHKLAERHNLVNPDGSTRRIHLAPPQNPMHGGELFARPVVEGGKLENCLLWAEYPYKNRSKHGIPSRETYFNSEFKSNMEKRAATKYKQPSTTTKEKA